MRPRCTARGARRGRLIEQARSRSRHWSAPMRATSSSPPAAPRRTRSRCRPRSSGGDKRPFDRLLVSAIEHPSVLAGGRFRPAAARQLPVDAGRHRSISRRWSERLRSARADSAFWSRSWLANNETGVIQPVARGGRHRASPWRPAARRCRAGGGPHAARYRGAGRRPDDAVRAQDRRPARAPARWSGATRLHFADPLIRGGGQERGSARRHRECRRDRGIRRGGGRRDGEIRRPRCAHMAALRDRLEAGLRAATPEAVIFGADAARLPNTTLVAVPGARPKRCSSPSILTASRSRPARPVRPARSRPRMFWPRWASNRRLARGAIRVSIGWRPPKPKSTASCRLGKRSAIPI